MPRTITKNQAISETIDAIKGALIGMSEAGVLGFDCPEEHRGILESWGKRPTPVRREAPKGPHGRTTPSQASEFRGKPPTRPDGKPPGRPRRAEAPERRRDSPEEDRQKMLAEIRAKALAEIREETLAKAREKARAPSRTRESGSPRKSMDPRMSMDPREAMDPRESMGPGESMDPRDRMEPRESMAPRKGSSGETLMDIRKDLGWCKRCNLHPGRENIVFGAGRPDARLVFVGEGPGFDEDKAGEPFVGAAGRLLTKIIQAIKLDRDQVYICNIIKCRPPGNRTPFEDEIAACSPFVFRQLKAIQPDFVCALGAVASQTLLQSNKTMGELRGRLHDRMGMKILPTWHPAYLLRHPEKKRGAWEDMKMLMRAMGAGALKK